MLENRILHFVCILLLIHWVVSNPQHHHDHLDPYGNGKSFSPQQQFDGNQNFYLPNSQNSQQYGNYVLAAAAGEQPFGNDASGTPNHHVSYPYPTTSPSHSSSHLWSSAPIIVTDEVYNVEQTSSGFKNNLQTRPRNSKALDQTYNNSNNNNEAGPQPLPSNYNYQNPTVYRSSDVWRQHPQQQQQYSIKTSPQSREPSSSNYNQQQQQHYLPPSSTYQYRQQQQQQEQESYLLQQQQQQQQHHQLHASNTDLNYLQATPINHKPYFSSVTSTVGQSGGIGEVEKNSLNDYSQHFKEYLRKHPRRIKPTY